MFSPDARTIGGAFLIQQEINGMNYLVDKVKSSRSKYAPENIPPPFKKPSAPKFLSSDFKRIDPRHCVSSSSSSPRSSSSCSNNNNSRRPRIPDKSLLSSRIANDIPSSFAFSLQNRKREEEWKRRANEQKEVRRPSSARGREESRERKFTEHARKVLKNRPEWDPTSQVAASLCMSASAGEDGAHHHQPSAETNGLKTLLADCAREENQEQARKRQIAKIMMKTQKLQYTADGVAKFVAADDQDMKNMLLSHLDRNHHHLHMDNSSSILLSDSSIINHNSSHHHHPPPGTLVKEAAKRILQRVDCMGDRVSALHRENIAYSVAQMVPVSKSTSNNNSNNNNNNNNLSGSSNNRVFSEQVNQFDRRASQDKDFEDDDEDATNDDENSTRLVARENTTSPVPSANVVADQSNNISNKPVFVGEENGAAVKSATSRNNSTSSASSATPPPPLLTKESPTPTNNPNNNNNSNSAGEASSSSREERQRAVLTYDDDEENPTSDHEHHHHQQDRRSSVTLIPSPPPRRNSKIEVPPETVAPDELEESPARKDEEQEHTATTDGEGTSSGLKTHAPTRFVIG